MTQDDACADLLIDARARARPVSGIAHLIDDSHDAGYLVQALVDRRHRAAGRKAIGWKVGWTTPEPMLGILYEDSILPDGAVLDLGRACAPKIEGEILIRIAQVPDPDCDAATLLASIATVQAAMEIADCAIADWAAPVGHWIADNACCGWILPASGAVAPDTVDLAAVHMQLLANGDVIAQGQGRDCGGGALQVYRWFLQAAARQARVVRPGDIVMTGSIGRPTPINADTHYHLRITGDADLIGEARLATANGA